MEGKFISGEFRQELISFLEFSVKYYTDVVSQFTSDTKLSTDEYKFLLTLERLSVVLDYLCCD